MQVLGLILWIVCWTDLFSSFHEMNQNPPIPIAPIYFVTPLIVGMTMVSENSCWICCLCPKCLIFRWAFRPQNFLRRPSLKPSCNNDLFSSHFSVNCFVKCASVIRQLAFTFINAQRKKSWPLNYKGHRECGQWLWKCLGCCFNLRSLIEEQDVASNH